MRRFLMWLVWKLGDPVVWNARVEVVARVGGAEAERCAHRLRWMYALWEGDLSREAGIHRFQTVPPEEDRGRIHTSTVEVIVDGHSNDAKVRTYNLVEDRVTDHGLKVTVRPAWRVLDGDLAEFYS